MKLTDKAALLLVVHALPTADIWHEISTEEVNTIFQQAGKELARLESIEWLNTQQKALKENKK